MSPSAAADQAQASHSVHSGSSLRARAALQTTEISVCSRARPDGSGTQTHFATGMIAPIDVRKNVEEKF